jgi:hypothetical protein
LERAIMEGSKEVSGTTLKGNKTMLLAYHNNPAIKEKYLQRVNHHAEMDEIIHGTGWEGGKGCAVGCTMHAYNHAAYETEIGVPQSIARLEDAIFEGMKNGDSKLFPARFLKAIPVGADLSLVTARFMVWLLSDSDHGVIRFTKGHPKSADAVYAVTALYERVIAGETISPDKWKRAARAAAAEAAAAAAAAEAAAEAAEAAEAAAEAAAWAAEAAEAAAAWAAWAAARAAHRSAYKAMAEKLLQLLSEAPVPVMDGK